MSSSADFVQFVADQVSDAGDISYRKMFGEYMLYCDERPVLLICDDTVYVKQIPETLSVFMLYDISPDSDIPYRGGRPHYILDIENIDMSTEMVRVLARITPLPKSHRGKKYLAFH